MNNLNGLRMRITDQYKNFSEQFTGDGSTKVFDLSHFPILSGTAFLVYVTGSAQNDPTGFSCSYDDGRLTFVSAPTAGGMVQVYGKRSVFSDSELAQVLTDHSLATGSAMTSLDGLDAPVLTCVDTLMSDAYRRHNWAAAGGQSVSEGQIMANLKTWRDTLINKQRGTEVGPQGGWVPWAQSQEEYGDDFSG
jgi:hypothetical protein